MILDNENNNQKVHEWISNFTEQGKFDIGLLVEITKFCKTKDIEINLSKEIKTVLIPTLRKDNIIDYNSWPVGNVL